MAEPLPLLICGAGRVVEALYAPALRHSPEFRLTAVVDPRPERRAWATRRLHAPAYASIDAAVAAQGVAAALVVVPPAEQAPVAMQLLEHGLATLTEKPGARSRAEAEHLLELAGGRPLRLALSRRFWRRYRRLASRIKGPPAAWEVRVQTDPNAWHSIAAVTGDPLTDLMDDLLPHAYDLARHVLGADLSQPESAAWDGARLSVRFGAGSEGSIVIGHGRAWHEIVAWHNGSLKQTSVAAAGGWRQRNAAFGSLLRRAQRRPSEPVQAVAALLTAFAADVRTGARNDDLFAYTTLSDRVRDLTP